MWAAFFCGWGLISIRLPSMTSTDKPSRQAVMDKIEAILSDMGLHWNYAHGIARGMHKKEKLDFCTDEELHKVMQGLAVYQNRKRQNRQRKKAKQEGNE